MNRKGSKNPNWKGNKAGLHAMHNWIKKVRGQAEVCEDCHRTSPPRGRGIKRSYFEWANVSGFYLRTLEDWKRLCNKCHRKFDESRHLDGKIQKNNTSGYKGVIWMKKINKWRAEGFKNNERIFLGEFKTKTEAIRARKKYEAIEHKRSE